MNNEKYWENFYKDFDDLQPSDFAKWIVPWLEKEGVQSIVDIGCGNGRDTYYLGKHFDHVVGVDASSLPKETPSVSFVQDDAVSYQIEGFDAVYSRFFFHSLTEFEVDEILGNCFNILVAEFRSDKGVVPCNTHYRRLINGHDFILSLIGRHFDIISYTECQGLAKYKDEDPICIRVVARRRKNNKKEI